MNEVSLHCSECPFKTNSNRKLGRHTALAHANWKYRCPLCPFDSCYVASLYRHKKEVHHIGLNNQNELQNFEYSDEDEDQDGIEVSTSSDDKTFTMSTPKTLNRLRRTSSRGSRGSGSSGTPQCDAPDVDKELLPCRIQRRYKCTTCDLQTRNPRDYLYHLRDIHGEKLKVYECNQCLYASRHQQKLQRHLSFGHSAKGVKVSLSPTVKLKHPMAKKTMKRSRPFSSGEIFPPPVVKTEVIENDDNQYDAPEVDYGVTYQSDGYPEMFAPEDEDYHLNNVSYDNSDANNYMENLYNVQMLEEPPEEEILEIIDGEVDEVMNMSSCDVGSPTIDSPQVDSPVVWKPDDVGTVPQSHIPEDHRCSKCSFTSKSKMLVQRHEKVKHMKRKSYHCSKCNYVTNVRGRYTKHMKYHDLPYIKCDMCDFKTPYRWNMDRHMKNHTVIEGNYHCTLCNFATDTKQSLSFHTFNHHHDGESTNQLGENDPDCGRKTILYSELISMPSTTNDTNSPVPQDQVEDTDCSALENGKRRAPYVNLRAVAVRKGKFKRRFRCHQCSFIANSRSGLYRHKIQHKNEVLNKELSKGNAPDKNDTRYYMNMENVIRQEGAEKPLKCKLCSYEAKWISEMVKHQRIHTHEKPFVCPFCGFRSRWKGDMTRHIEKYHDESKKTETVTTKNEYSRPFLTTRKRRRLEEQEAFDRERNQANADADGSLILRNQPPRIRKRRAIDRNNSSQHLENDTDTAVVSTEVIKKIEVDDSLNDDAPELGAAQDEQESNLPSSLRVLRRHYRCPYCEFSAATASRFHVHIVAHFNQRPFMCSECGYRSNWQWDITKHIRLKIARQQSHYNAKLETLNDFGNRNYEKYIKYVVYDDTSITDDSQINASEGHEFGEGAMKLRPTHWKCKQCPYTSTRKRLMLHHLPKHCPDRAFFCGECGQASRWKENVERHCRIQHGNIIRMIENREAVAAMEANGLDNVQIYDDMTDKDGFIRDAKDSSGATLTEINSEAIKTESTTAQSALKGAEAELLPLKRHACKICPYRTKKIHDMQIHMTMHQPQPGTIFKCMFCPFYTSLRRSLLQHMKLHVSKPHEYISNALESAQDQEDMISVGAINNQVAITDPNHPFLNQTDGLDGMIEPAITISEENLPIISAKRYSCDHCPYTSDSRTQFLYHKQFHRNSRSCPFKCPMCSYAVTKAHLLNQHIRMHKNKSRTEVRPPQKQQTTPMSDVTLSKDSITIHSNVALQRKTGIPMVWVSKGATSMVKMYKCRFCPHVNKRRSNIREHEKMHRKRRMTGKFSCSFCTYVCNNQGVLSNHIKVHQNTSQLSDNTCNSQPVTNNQPDSAPEINFTPSEANETVLVSKNLATSQAQKVLFSCDICPERFTRPGDLRIHGKFHVADLPWKCTHCTYSAKHRSQLYRHMKVHSPNYIGRSSSAEVASEEATNQPVTQPRPASPRLSSPAKQPSKPGIKAPSENKHRCHLCPANFLKPSNLAYHLSLHGGTGRFKCPHCSYAVKNIGNLCRHTKVHDKARMKGIVAQPTGTPATSSVTASPQQDIAKRLSCQKCPATFDKFTRYDIHIKLHGSKQRFVCEFCDYSVPFMANLMKHQKLHSTIEGVTKELSMPCSVEEVTDTKPASAEPSPKKAIPQEPQDLSLSEQQMLMLLQHQQQMAQQLQQGADAKRYFFCDYCPYQHPRKDAVISHMKRHDADQEMVCPHCDYGTSTHSHAFIREHVKLHFQKPKRHRIDSYWKCEQAEIWAAESCGTSTLIFKDKGEDVDEISRFYSAGCETEPFIDEFVPDTLDSNSQVTICDIKNQNMDLDVALTAGETLTKTADLVKVFNDEGLLSSDQLTDSKLSTSLNETKELLSSGTFLTNLDGQKTLKSSVEMFSCQENKTHIKSESEIGIVGTSSLKSEQNNDLNYLHCVSDMVQDVGHSFKAESTKSVPTSELEVETDSSIYQICVDTLDSIIADIECDEMDRTLILEVDHIDLESEESSTKVDESDLHTMDAKDSVTTAGDASSIELVLEESSTESLEELCPEELIQDVTPTDLVTDSSEIEGLNNNQEIIPTEPVMPSSYVEAMEDMQGGPPTVPFLACSEVYGLEGNQAVTLTEPVLESLEVESSKYSQDLTQTVPVLESGEGVDNSQAVVLNKQGLGSLEFGCLEDAEHATEPALESSKVEIVQDSQVVTLTEPALESSKVEVVQDSQAVTPSEPVLESSKVASLEDSECGTATEPALESSKINFLEDSQGVTRTEPVLEALEIKGLEDSKDATPTEPVLESSVVEDTQDATPTEPVLGSSVVEGLEDVQDATPTEPVLESSVVEDTQDATPTEPVLGSSVVEGLEDSQDATPTELVLESSLVEGLEESELATATGPALESSKVEVLDDSDVITPTEPVLEPSEVVVLNAVRDAMPTKPVLKLSEVGDLECSQDLTLSKPVLKSSVVISKGDQGDVMPTTPVLQHLKVGVLEGIQDTMPTKPVLESKVDDLECHQAAASTELVLESAEFEDLEHSQHVTTELVLESSEVEVLEGNQCTTTAKPVMKSLVVDVLEGSVKTEELQYSTVETKESSVDVEREPLIVALGEFNSESSDMETLAINAAEKIDPLNSKLNTKEKVPSVIGLVTTSHNHILTEQVKFEVLAVECGLDATGEESDSVIDYFTDSKQDYFDCTENKLETLSATNEHTDSFLQPVELISAEELSVSQDVLTDIKEVIETSCPSSVSTVSGSMNFEYEKALNSTELLQNDLFAEELANETACVQKLIRTSEFCFAKHLEGETETELLQNEGTKSESSFIDNVESSIDSEIIGLDNTLLIQTECDNKDENGVIIQDQEPLEVCAPSSPKPVYKENGIPNDDICCEIVAAMNDENQLHIEIIGQ